jgi:DNA-directed RNA polymerase alpha subunit
MGLRSFLKNAARALGLRNPSFRSTSSRNVDSDVALARFEQQIAEAAVNRDSVKLLDLWHEISLWKAPPPKTHELKERLAQLFKEFEGQVVNPNVSSSTLLLLRSQISSKQSSERQQERKERLAQEAEAKPEPLKRRISMVQETLQDRQAQIESNASDVEDLQPEARGTSTANSHIDPGLNLEPLAEDVVPLNGTEQAEPTSPETRPPSLNWLNQPIQDLSLSIRASNALHYGGFRTVADLAGKQSDDLLNILNFGQKSLDELISALERKGIPFPVPTNPQQEGQKSQAGTGDYDDKSRLSSATTLLRDLEIPQTTLGPLLRSGIKTLGDLAGWSESDLAEIRNLGPKGIETLRQILVSKGLGLPFHSSDLELAPHQQHEDDQAYESSKEDRKQRRQEVIALVSDLAEKCLAERSTESEEVIEVLLQRSDLHEGHAGLHVEMSILRSSLGVIESLLGLNILSNQAHEAAWKEVKKYLLLRYAQELSNDTSKSWLNSLQTSIKKDSDRGWSSYIMRVCGTTYQAIGEQLHPPVTRESIRHRLKRVAGVVGVFADALTERIQDSATEEAASQQLACIQSWLDRLGRLAFKGDQPLADEDMDRWSTTIRLNPKQRLEIYHEFNIPVPAAEWDLHYEWITSNSSGMGNGYWKDFECLKQCIHRHAVKIGEPELMPKQTSLPRRVGRIVQDFGGQSKVACRLGLRYQGQLVGEDGGRTYWTEDKLFKLLDDINQFHNQDLSLMPSYDQIYEFFKEQVDEPYVGKKPGSPIASMNRQGRLHWSEVARRFGKQFIAGSSTQNITLPVRRQ